MFIEKNKSYCFFFLALALIYIVVYSIVLALNGFMPYVMDANETYSSLIHASNLFQFGFSETIGLTDEAYGPEKLAHPFVYSHQGNFPRIFAWILYVLGARSVELQTIITTFTVGLVAVYFAYHFFSKVVNPLFSFIVCAMLITNYILFIQWHIVTFRAWHAFFFFSTFLCAYYIESPRKTMWSILISLNYYFLFYFEFVFAIFVTLGAAFFTVALYAKNKKSIMKAFIIYAVGALAAISTLIAQNIAYLGLDNFLQDARLTFFARNFTNNSLDFSKQLEEFYNKNHIVFWYNLFDGAKFYTLNSFLNSLFVHNFSTATPYFCLLSATILTGWAFTWGILKIRFILNNTNKMVLKAIKKFREIIKSLGWSGTSSIVLMAGAFYYFLKWTILYFCNVEAIPSQILFIPTRILLLIAAFPFFIIFMADFLNEERKKIDSYRIVFCAVFLFLLGYFIKTQYGIFEESNDLSPLWSGLIPRWFSNGVKVLCFIGSVLLVVRYIIFSDKPPKNSYFDLPPGLLWFLVCGFLAYIILYFMFPGYLVTAYLNRYAPLGVFVFQTLFGVALFILIKYFSTTYREYKSSASSLGLFFRFSKMFYPMLSLSLILVLVGYWLGIQYKYYQFIPPNRFEFLSILKKEPFLGASFISNTYAAPIAHYTNKWAYIDPDIVSAKVVITEQGYEVKRDMTHYLWLADRDKNKEYEKPEYFVCMLSKVLGSVASELKDGPVLNCGNMGIVKRAHQQDGIRWPTESVVLEDTSKHNAWAIVKLDWKEPPFLRKLSSKKGIDSFVDVKADNGEDGRIRLSVHYQYKQRDHDKEGNTIIRIYSNDKSSRSYETRKLLLEQSAEKPILIPQNFKGNIIVSVIPASVEKKGPEYFSRNSFFVDNNKITEFENAILPPLETRQKI